MGMGELFCQVQRILAPPHGLCWIAQTPQRKSRIGQAPHPWRLANMECQGLLHRRVRECDPLLQVRPGRGIFTEEEQGTPKGVMSLQTGRWCGRALCQSRELLSQLPRRL